MRTKAEIRAWMRQRRATWAAVALAQGSAEIARRCLTLPVVASARTVFCFLPIPGAGEPDTTAIIETLQKEGKTVVVPGEQPEEMLELISRAACAATPTSRGVPLPRERRLWTGTVDVALVPGVAFTVKGARLGRGGGFYDRWLAAHRDTPAVGLAFAEQVLEELPVETHDQRVDWIVTPKRVIPCSK